MICSRHLSTSSGLLLLCHLNQLYNTENIGIDPMVLFQVGGYQFLKCLPSRLNTPCSGRFSGPKKQLWSDCNEEEEIAEIGKLPFWYNQHRIYTILYYGIVSLNMARITMGEILTQVSQRNNRIIWEVTL